MDLIKWQLNFGSYNFRLKSYFDFKSNSRYALLWFWNHAYDFRANWTPLSSVTIINQLGSEVELEISYLRLIKRRKHTDNLLTPGVFLCWDLTPTWSLKRSFTSDKQNQMTALRWGAKTSVAHSKIHHLYHSHTGLTSAFEPVSRIPGWTRSTIEAGNICWSRFICAVDTRKTRISIESTGVNVVFTKPACVSRCACAALDYEFIVVV